MIDRGGFDGLSGLITPSSISPSIFYPPVLPTFDLGLIMLYPVTLSPLAGTFDSESRIDK